MCAPFSRTAAEAANSRFSKKSKTPSKVDSEEQPYSGNILLRFKHSSKLMEGKVTSCHGVGCGDGIFKGFYSQPFFLV